MHVSSVQQMTDSSFSPESLESRCERREGKIEAEGERKVLLASCRWITGKGKRTQENKFQERIKQEWK